MELFKSLENTKIFKGLNAEEIKNYLKDIQFFTRKYRKDTVIAFRGDQCESLMLILKGKVKAEMIDYEGKSVQISTLGVNNAIAPAFIFGGKNYFPVNAVSSTDVEMFVLPKDSIIKLTQISKTILVNYLDLISNRVQFLTDRIWCMSFQTIKEKLIHYIFDILPEKEDKVKLDKSQRELAEFFGVSRPALGRIFSELQNEGLLLYQKKEVIIKDKRKLLKLLKS